MSVVGDLLPAGIAYVEGFDHVVAEGHDAGMTNVEPFVGEHLADIAQQTDAVGACT